jgi:hypothetical protein
MTRSTLIDPALVGADGDPIVSRRLAWRPSARARNLTLFALSVAGYLVLASILWWGFSNGNFGVPGGDVTIWDRAGDAVRAGVNPYELAADNPIDAFWYAPPFAVAFGLVSWLPTTIVWVAIVVLEVLALRYVAGSWRNVGILGWFPLTAFEVVSGNFNLIIVAGIVLAIRGRPELATIMSFAKASPILAVHPRDWRRALPVAGLAIALTLPAAWLWPAWIGAVAGSFGTPIGLAVPVPFAVRAVIAAGLLLLWRPWSRALAAAIAIPAFYYASILLILVILADRRRPAWFRRSDPIANLPLVDRRRAA